MENSSFRVDAVFKGRTKLRDEQNMVRRFSFASLRFRLILLVLFAVIPSLGLMLYTGFEQRRLAGIEAKTETQRLVRFISAKQQQLIEGTRQLLTILARLPVVLSCNPDPCCTLFANMMRQYPQYANIGAATPDGHVFASAVPLSGPVNAADRTYFQRAVKTRDFAIGDYQIGRITGKASINFGYPVFDTRGQIKAIIFAALNLSWLNYLAAEAHLPRRR